MVKSLSTKIIPYLFLLFLIIPPLHAQYSPKEDSVQLTFQNLPLKIALDSLIQTFGMNILYQDRHVDGWAVSLNCNPCSKVKSLEQLLNGSRLIWKQKNNQFVISKPWFVPIGRSLSGIVTDRETGEPLPYVNVFIQNSYLGTITNQDGYFTLMGAPLTTMALHIAHMGYKTKIHDLSDSPSNAQLEIQLMPTVLTGNPILVVGSHDQLLDMESNSHHSVSPRLVEQVPGYGQKDVMRTLQLLPGVISGKVNDAGIYVRGGTPNQNLVMFDGITMYHVDHMFGFFSAFNPAAIKNIQVYKGGFSAKYGGRLSSVLNLSGKNGNSKKTGVSIYTNLLSTGVSFDKPILNRKGTIFFSARRSHVDLLKSPLYDQIFNYISGDNIGGLSAELAQADSVIIHKKDPRFYFYDLNTKITFMPTPKDVISYSLYHGKDYYNHSLDETTIGLDINTRYRFKLDDQNKWGNLGQSMRWARQWDSGIYSNFFFSSSEYQTEYQSTSSYDGPWDDPFKYQIGEKNTVRDVTIKLENDWYYSSSHSLGFGFGLSNFDSKYTGEYADMTTIVLNQTDSPHYFGYFQDKWTPNSKLKIVGGLRGNYYKKTSQFYIEPRISGVYKISNTFSLNGAAGVYYQFLNRFINENSLDGANDFWMVSDDFNPPGKSNHFMLGAQWNGTPLSIEVETYYKSLKNLIEFDRFSPFLTEDPFLIGNGTASGIDVLFKNHSKILQSWLTLSMSKVAYTFPRTNGGKSFLADHDRTHQIKWLNIYNLRKWQLSSTWTYSSGHPYTPLSAFKEGTDDIGFSYNSINPGSKNSERLKPNHQLNIHASRIINIGAIKVNIELGIINLYNFKGVSYRRYQYWEYPIKIRDIYTMPFSPTIGIQFQL